MEKPELIIEENTPEKDAQVALKNASEKVYALHRNRKTSRISIRLIE